VQEPLTTRVAALEPAASTVSFLQRSAYLDAQGSPEGEAERRRIRLTAVQCRTD
jgi:hypothetical protein